MTSCEDCLTSIAILHCYNLRKKGRQLAFVPWRPDSNTLLYKHIKNLTSARPRTPPS